MFKLFILPILLVDIAFCDDLNHIVDLTWDFDGNTIFWKGVTPFSYTKVVAENKGGYWYAANEFCLGEHGGTHFDAPYHFNEEGWKVGDVPITKLVARGALIDLSLNGATALLPQHLEAWVRKNGPLDDNTILLVKFGRSQHWGNKTAYLGIDANGNYNFPGISVQAAKWIVNGGRIVGVGLDTPSVDPGNSSDMMSHRILSENQIYNIENVKMLINLPARGFTVVVLPMKLKDGTGAPARVLVVPKGFW